MDKGPPTAVSNARCSFIRESVFPYLSVRPIGLRNSVRLYVGYGTALYGRIFVDRLGASVGAGVPGRDLLTVSFSGIRAYIRPGTNDLDILVHHEPKTLSWFRPRAGELVVDVGAHIGRYTLLAAKAGARVVSIEPDPSNFNILAANVRLNQLEGVSLLRVGLSNLTGVRDFLPSEGTNRGTSSFVTSAGAEGVEGQTSRRVLVDCLMLDELIDKERIRRIDWLKIDAEGHEPEVLAGAARSLQVTRNLIVEVAAGNEAICERRLADFHLKDVERGHPTSNWLLEGAT